MDRVQMRGENEKQSEYNRYHAGLQSKPLRGPFDCVIEPRFQAIRPQFHMVGSLRHRLFRGYGYAALRVSVLHKPFHLHGYGLRFGKRLALRLPGDHEHRALHTSWQSAVRRFGELLKRGYELFETDGCGQPPAAE